MKNGYLNTSRQTPENNEQQLVVKINPLIRDDSGTVRYDKMDLHSIEEILKSRHINIW